jgi:general secretion pathway protein I
LSQSTPPLDSGSRGFTLVEALVALSVLMVVLSAIGGLSASSLRSGLYVERHVADIENVRQILTGLPSRDELAGRSLSGETAGYKWRLDVEPFSADFVDARAQTNWAPETIVLTVKGPGGSLLSFDSVRLVRVGAK